MSRRPKRVPCACGRLCVVDRQLDRGGAVPTCGECIARGRPRPAPEPTFRRPVVRFVPPKPAPSLPRPTPTYGEHPPTCPFPEEPGWADMVRWGSELD